MRRERMRERRRFKVARVLVLNNPHASCMDRYRCRFSRSAARFLWRTSVSSFSFCCCPAARDLQTVLATSSDAF
jgi:hypothetical protein